MTLKRRVQMIGEREKKTTAMTAARYRLSSKDNELNERRKKTKKLKPSVLQ